jgi:hypothetical protein
MKRNPLDTLKIIRHIAYICKTTCDQFGMLETDIAFNRLKRSRDRYEDLKDDLALHLTADYTKDQTAERIQKQITHWTAKYKHWEPILAQNLKGYKPQPKPAPEPKSKPEATDKWAAGRKAKAIKSKAKSTKAKATKAKSTKAKAIKSKGKKSEPKAELSLADAKRKALLSAL